MNAELLALLLKDIIIPEIAAVIRAHANATGGKMPTDAEILAALQIDANRYVASGEAWLKANAGK